MNLEYHWHRQRCMANPSAATRPPGPSGIPLLGNTLQFGRHTFEFLQQCREAYGDVVYFEVLGQPFYQLNDPDDIQHVLVDNNVNYTKGSFLTKQFGEFLGKGLLLNEGEDWRRQRHLLQPAFDPDRISMYAEMMTAHTERLLDDWQPGIPRNIHTEMTRLTLEIAASALLDVDIREESIELRAAFQDIPDEFRKRTARPISLPPVGTDATKPPIRASTRTSQRNHLRHHRAATRRSRNRCCLDATRSQFGIE